MDLKQQQPPLTVEEQLQNLRELGLTIDNDYSAQAMLNDVSYFRLIKAFSLGLKPRNGRYIEGTSFETIVQLYKFNSRFRQLLFPVIERVEINLRCRLANHFSNKYGVLGYEDAENFQNPLYHESFLKEIGDEIRRNKKSPFVKNFQENYVDGKLPLYALVELFSFGTLSKFFKNMKGEDKKAVANLYGINYAYLESWIESISHIRNICAHYGRLYNATFVKQPRLYRCYKGCTDSNRIFAILLCIKELNSTNPHWFAFVDELELLFEKYPEAKKETMGFPKNWKALLEEK